MDILKMSEVCRMIKNHVLVSVSLHVDYFNVSFILSWKQDIEMTPGECAVFSPVGDMFYISWCNCVPVFVTCTVRAVWIGEFVMNVFFKSWQLFTMTVLTVIYIRYSYIVRYIQPVCAGAFKIYRLEDV